MADDIVVGSVAVDIVPDTRNFRRNLNAKLQGLEADVSVKADTTGVRADLDELTQSRTVTIKTNADTAAASAQIDRTARTRTATVNTRVSGTSSIFQAVSGFGALTTAAITLGPALIPIAATIGGIGLALGAPLAIAAGGATVFGFLTGAVIKKTEEQKKKIDQLKKSVDAAKLSLANTKAAAATSASNSLVSASSSAAASLASAKASAEASLKSARQSLASATTDAARASARRRIAAAEAALATRQAAINTSLSGRQAAIQRSQSASVAAAQRKVTEATAAYQAALKGLTPAQSRFLDAQGKLKDAFKQLIETSGPVILGPVTQALKTLTGILPDITPLISSVSGALTGLLDDLGKAVKGPDFQAFIAAFSKQVGPDIVAFGHIAGNVFKGVAGLVIQLGNAFGPGLLKGLENLTGKLAALGDQGAHSQKLQDFVDYFHRVGPGVASAIGAVARAVGHVVQALAPLGPPILKVVEGIANQISAIPVPTLTALATAFVAMTAAAKVGKGLSALGLLEGGALGGGKSGALASVVRKGAPVPVFVTNEGFGAPGRGGNGAPTVLTKGAKAAAAEADAAKAAAAAAAAVKAAGGGAVEQSSAAARAFKEAMAAHDTAVLKSALDFGVKGGVRGLLGTLLAAPAGITLADQNAEVIQNKGPIGSKEQLEKILLQEADNQQEIKAILSAFHITPERARQLANIPEIKARTTHVDALRASLDKASRTIDQIGPHADNAFGQASKDVDKFGSKLAAIHDKKIRILVDDLAAVRSLEALQAYRLKNKTLTINIEQELDRAVGPGGGRGRPTGSGGSGGGATRADAPRIATSPRSATSSTSPIHVDKMFLTDTNDVLRKADRQVRNRAGGGVTFPPPLVSSFAGAQ